MSGTKQDQSAKEGLKQDVTNRKPPCLFVIHISVSAEAAAAIRDYISLRGKMNIDSETVVESSDGFDAKGARDLFLQEGLTRATHVLGLISAENPEPWWLKRLTELAVNYSVQPAVLTLKGMADVPDVPQGVEILRGIKSLNEYVFRESPDVEQIIFNNPEYGGLMAHTAPNHPLDAYLDWNK